MRVIFINGTVGAGKTTTMDAVGAILRDAKVEHALVDLDGISRRWPPPHDDPFNTRVAYLNLAALTDSYRHSGAEVMVIAGVLEDADQRERCEAMVAIPMTVVRLRPYGEAIRERLRHRHDKDAVARDWHLERSEELPDILHEARLDDAVVEVGAEAPAEVARKVLAAAGLVD